MRSAVLWVMAAPVKFTFACWPQCPQPILKVKSLSKAKLEVRLHRFACQ